jgi:PKD repeat protein
MKIKYYLLTMVMMATAVGGTEPYSYGWSFGDGEQDTGQSIIHAYQNPGTY